MDFENQPETRLIVLNPLNVESYKHVRLNIADYLGGACINATTKLKTHRNRTTLDEAIMYMDGGGKYRCQPEDA